MAKEEAAPPASAASRAVLALQGSPMFVRASPCLPSGPAFGARRAARNRSCLNRLPCTSCRSSSLAAWRGASQKRALRRSSGLRYSFRFPASILEPKCSDLCLSEPPPQMPAVCVKHPFPKLLGELLCSPLRRRAASNPELESGERWWILQPAKGGEGCLGCARNLQYQLLWSLTLNLTWMACLQRQQRHSDPDNTLLRHTLLGI